MGGSCAVWNSKVHTAAPWRRRGCLAPILSMAALLSLVCSPAWGESAREAFPSDPACWEGPRIYHAGPPPAELADQVNLVHVPAKGPTPGEATVSPNAGYRFWVRNPDTGKPGPWGAGVIVDVQGNSRPTLLLQNVAQPIHPRWINEKLIYLRVAWGRVQFSDLIFDVEESELIYHEHAIYGENAYRQFRQACDGRCPCEAGNGAAALADPAADAPAASTPAPAKPTGPRHKLLPAAVPGDDSLIGLITLPGIFGPPESGGLPAHERVPVPVYASPEAGAAKLGEPGSPDAFETREYSYESDAVVVYTRQPGWYQIGLAGGKRAWLSAKSAGGFFPIGELLTNRLAYLNEHWDRKLWESPNIFKAWNSRLKQTGAGERVEIPVKIVASREVEGGLWLQVQTLSAPPCEGGEPRIVDRGWIPAYSGAGELVAGYYSRGC